MAARWVMPSEPFVTLDSCEKVSEKLKQHSLVVILFNSNLPQPDDIEHIFNKLRTNYEKQNNLFVYKCVISAVSKDLKAAYSIKKSPTFIFFRGGQEVDRIENANKLESPANSSQQDVEAASSSSSKSMASEAHLKSWLDKCCASAPK